MLPPNGLQEVLGAVVRHLLTRSQVVPPPPPAVMGYRSKIANPSNPPRRGQCTHITMNRLHGDHVCQMCGRIPKIGWLYACRQDWLVENQQESVASAAESAIVVPDESDYFDVMARFASSIKMSPSVIKQIRDGHYNYDQVERLVAQKEHLISTIKKLEGLSTENTPSSLHSNVFQSHANIIASIGTSNSPSSSHKHHLNVPSSSGTAAQQNHARKGSGTSTTSKQSRLRPDRCNYMVCHACRPFLHDRLFANVDSILDGVYPPITEGEAKTLPMMNPAIVRGFGLRQGTATPVSSPRRLERSDSLDIAMMSLREGDDEDETTLEWTTSSNSSSFYDDDSQELRPFDPHPCPGPGVCPVYSRNSGCAYDSQDFDDGQRALNHGHAYPGGREASNDITHTTPERPRARLHRVEGGGVLDTPGRTSSSASSISLPSPIIMPLTPDTPTRQRHGEDLQSKPGKAATVCGVLSPVINFGHARLSVASDMSGKNSRDSFGSEVEVDGGVALTEEAVETGLPNILTAA
jgi:hypothetical protein